MARWICNATQRLQNLQLPLPSHPLHRAFVYGKQDAFNTSCFELSSVVPNCEAPAISINCEVPTHISRDPFDKDQVQKPEVEVVSIMNLGVSNSLAIERKVK